MRAFMSQTGSVDQQPVGILGGGQLARMLAQAAKGLGLDVRALAGRADDPAARVCPAVVGPFEEARVLRQFLSQVGTVAFENEFLDTAYLARIAGEFTDVRFHPTLAVLERLQDKRNQKQLLDRLSIATAPWKDVPDVDSLGAVLKQFPEGCVLKWARLGYDGKGLFFPASAKVEKAAETFVAQALARGSRVYAESKVPFKRELAIVAVRSITGELTSYPLVHSKQDQGVCALVTGPATGLGNSADQESKAVEYAKRLAEALDYVGVLALELFEREDGVLLVNEIAPRVHNSGHYSQDAAPASQFENHWRALLGMPLGKTRSRGFFAMWNLLGPPGFSLDALRAPAPQAPAGAHLHWYEKTEIRPRRKMGHLNATAATSEELARRVTELERADRIWRERLAEEGGLSGKK